MPNIDLELNTKFESFIIEMDQETGQPTVVGIKVSQNGKTQEIFCSKGVGKYIHLIIVQINTSCI